MKWFSDKHYKAIKANSRQVEYLASFGINPSYCDKDYFYYWKSEYLDMILWRYQIQWDLIPNKK